MERLWGSFLLKRDAPTSHTHAVLALAAYAILAGNKELGEQEKEDGQMETDSTQQPVRGLTRLALLKGVWVLLTLAVVAGVAATFWARRSGFWAEHLSLFGPLWFMVLGSWLILTAEIQVVRERLQLTRKRAATTFAHHSLMGTALGLAFICQGLLLLLDQALDLSLSVEVGVFISLGWLCCCVLAVYSFHRWRTHRAPPPRE